MRTLGSTKPAASTAVLLKPARSSWAKSNPASGLIRNTTNASTLNTLQLLDNTVFDKYKFATITFEHDIYSTMLYKTNKPFNPETRRLSREIFNNRGYIMVFDDVNNGGENPYEDWYVHPDLVDMNHINKLKDMNKNNYKDTPSMGLSYKMKSINYQDIIY
jgi:hypothetical protein